MPPPPTATTIQPKPTRLGDGLLFDDFDRLGRRHDAPPAAAGILDDLPALGLEFAGLRLVHEAADGLGRVLEGGIVGLDPHLRHDA